MAGSGLPCLTGCVQDAFKIGICNFPPIGQPYSLLSLANSCGARSLFAAIRRRFLRLYTKRVGLPAALATLPAACQGPTAHPGWMVGPCSPLHCVPGCQRVRGRTAVPTWHRRGLRPHRHPPRAAALRHARPGRQAGGTGQGHRRAEGDGPRPKPVGGGWLLRGMAGGTMEVQAKTYHVM